MATQEVSIERLRTNLAELLGRVEFGNEQVVVTKYRRKAAVLISHTEYTRLLNNQKQMTPDKQGKNSSSNH